MKKILLIEDDVELADLLITVLSKFFEVHHSLEADKIRNLIPAVDLVLSDYNFGIPNFYFEDIRDLCVEHSKPVILQSSILESRHVPQLTKPYPMKLLIDQINRMF